MPEPRTLEDLLDIHAIHELKHRYLRCLDQKAWAELETCFTEDATASYGGGAIELDGRAAILAFLTDSMGSTGMLTSHRGSQPEIELTGHGEATGTWALEDVVIHQDFGVTIHGASFYADRYVKVDGRWHIKTTGYKRTYEEIWPRASIEGLRLSADLWATGGRSDLV
ncbi:MAG: nuclear transport factor 2 family protein [Acidimicrobiales bacterium]